MSEPVSVSLPVSGRVLDAVTYGWRVAKAAGLDDTERARLTAAALALASAGADSLSFTLRAEPDPELHIASSSSETRHVFPVASLFELPSPNSGSQDDLAELGTSILAVIRSAAESAEQLRATQATCAALEGELEETNRGVLALYAELDERADKLRRADELKSRFLSYASHELRTPLNGIIGLVRLLRTGKSPAATEELKQLSFIQQAAEEMREMVNDLLDLAKVEAGKVSIEPTEFGLEFVFGALRGIFRPLLQTEDVVLRFEDTSAVPSIYSDEAKVSQILRNFISNALKFTEHGEVRVWAVANNGTIEIFVRDTGIGIAPQNLERIFEEYAQIPHPLQKKSRGTGLGLPLCRRLAELLGGRVEVQSEVGKGSTFSLILPRKFAPGEVAAPAPESRTGIAARAQVPTVLVVDDAEIDRYLLKQLLNAGGEYRIIEAEDGQAALDTALREKPDFIFLDLTLPKIDGFQVLSTLRREPSTSELAVAVVTARTLSERERSELAVHGTGVFDKAALASARKLSLRLSPPVGVDVVY